VSESVSQSVSQSASYKATVAKLITLHIPQITSRLFLENQRNPI